MIHLLLVLLFLSSAYANSLDLNTHSKDIDLVLSRNGKLRIMTFNIWLSGAEVTDGMKKIARHILANNPDIVALQEIWTTDVIGNLTSLMGDKWTGICKNQSYPDAGILSRHKVHLAFLSLQRMAV
ncbi:hypothetical protein L596_012961 [Steinernema carpocapsae]|uniref:Endonuclease/exonuclease/phosphatase domain-containing protein n=1 Tax=Steinernema carpocapsae TaxID=34508 RepID=A0A4U5NYZ2_STECR|nr:hypothetical protein L596_012961 [Steinernema carpocapsae]